MWYLYAGAAGVAGAFTLLVSMFVKRNSERSDTRLAELSGKMSGPSESEVVDNFTRMVHATLPKMGEKLLPGNEKERTQLASRLVSAGLYSPMAMPVFLGVKVLLTIGPMVLAVLLASLRVVPTQMGLLGGIVVGIFGMIAPSFWLDRRKSRRQTMLRRGLPDACDLIVICMSGGLSLIGAVQRVVDELKTAHPLLASELRIVEREVQLGHKLADSLQKFGTRSDLVELQNLAAVVMTAEKYGSSMARTLDKFSEALRLKRQQYAEAMAQKAATKVLFPTLLFIFPVILMIILGPAAIQVFQMMQGMQR